MRRRYLVFPAALIFSAFALAACGSGGANDEDQIVEAIRTAMTAGDPASCAKLETQAFMEQSTKSAGKEAVKACEEHAAEVKDNPKTVAISKVEVDGSAATADVAFTGGGFNGQVAIFALVKKSDRWRLDEVTGLAKLDKAKVIEQFETELADPSNKISKSTADCFVKTLEKAPQAKIEELMLSSSTEPTSRIIESCS